MFFDAECAPFRTRDINKLAAQEEPAIKKALFELHLQPDMIGVYAHDGRLRVAITVSSHFEGFDWESKVREFLGPLGYTFELVGPDGAVASEELQPLPLQAVSPSALPVIETIEIPIEVVPVVVTDKATITTDVVFVVQPKPAKRSPRRTPVLAK